MKVLLFKGEQCPQCKVWSPKVEALCKDLGVECEVINADDNQELCASYLVRSIPYVIVVSDAGIIDRGHAAVMFDKIKDYV